MSDLFEQARQYFADGVVHFEAGRWDDAERTFRASLGLLPGRVSTLNNLAATLTRLRRPGEALTVLDESLTAEPGNVEAISHRGVALSDLGRPEEALASFDAVLKAEPRRAAAWYFRGIALNVLGRHDAALTAFEQFLDLDPGNGETWFRHGQTLHYLGRHEAALASFDRALAIDPGLAPAWTNRGSILKDMQRLDVAAAAFEQALAHGGDQELNTYFLASVRGQDAPPAAPPHYVRGLFDDYAESFDEHLVDVLHYRAHLELTDNLKRLAGRRFDRALDLGCGTGLCGPAVKSIAAQVDGVDLSSGMLAQAEHTGVYNQLVRADVAAYLRATDQRFDLVLAADVFIYIGDLEPVFEGVRRVLDPGGMFCFSVELPEAGKDVELKTTLRYGQSERYVRELAQRHGFAISALLQHPIREDQQQPIAGLYAYLIARPMASAAAPSAGGRARAGRNLT